MKGARTDRTKGPASLVLLPGMDGTGILFAPLLKELDKRIKPLIVPYPPDKPLSYDELLKLVHSAVPEGRPYALLGESFSGPLAIRMAAENPEGLAAVILVSTFIRNPLPWLPSWTRHFAATPLFWFTNQFVRGKALVSGYGDPDLAAMLDMAHGSVKAGVMAKRAREILRVDVEEELKKIEAPVYYLGGEDDRVVPPKNLREILRARPDVKVRLVPGPHLVLQVNPKESAGAIAKIMTKEKVL